MTYGCTFGHFCGLLGLRRAQFPLCYSFASFPACFRVFPATLMGRTSRRPARAREPIGGASAEAESPLRMPGGIGEEVFVAER